MVASDGRRRRDATLPNLALELRKCGQREQGIFPRQKLRHVHEGDVVGKPVGRVAKVIRLELGERRKDSLDQPGVLVSCIGPGLVLDDPVLCHVRISHKFPRM